MKFFQKYDKTDIRSKDFYKDLYQESALNYPKAKHSLGWSTRKIHLDFLHNLILTLKPKIIVETGTFEGHGTYAIAAAAHINNNGARIFTHDYDGDPVQDEAGAVSDESWLELRALREDNIRHIQKTFGQCEVSYIEGDSRKTLPDTLKQFSQWNFWYQDSMHFAEGIQSEWDIMVDASADEAFVVFDDIGKKNQFSRDFVKTYSKQWAYTDRRDFDHKQCLAKKL